MYMMHHLGGATATDYTHHTGEADTATGDILGMAVTAGIHQAGTGDGTGTTTGDGTLGMQIHGWGCMIRSMTLGGDLHTGQATGLYTDLQYIRDINRVTIRTQGQAPNLTMEERYITAKGTAILLTIITEVTFQATMHREDRPREA